jgi:transposase
VAVAVNGLGTRLGEHRFRVTSTGYVGLERWAVGMGDVVGFGVEGTGSFGAGLARFLSGRGHTVIEVSRPDRSTRRRLGKSDPIDAEAAARAVLAGVAQGLPKSGTHNVEMIRMLKVAKDSALKARTQAINQMKALLVTAPADLRAALDGLSASRLVHRCVGFRPGDVLTPTAAAKLALRSIARRHRQLTAEIRALDADLTRLTAETAPALLQAFCIGPDTAATLLITAGDNPERLRSESAFAALCGVSPIPASSGKTNRHRLNRGGDRRANAALHRIVIVRLRHDERTRSYVERRVGEGMTKPEVIRCLKRYVAREVFAILRNLAQENLERAA